MESITGKRKGYIEKINTNDSEDSCDEDTEIKVGTSVHQQKHINRTKKTLNDLEEENKEYETKEEKKEEQKRIKRYYKSFDTECVTKRVYKYSSDFDENGVIYAIGTNFDFDEKTEWKNPSLNHNDREKRIIMTSYPETLYKGELSDMIGRTGTKCELNSGKIKNAWFKIDFVSVKIRVTHYTLRHGYKHDFGHLKSWNLEGSNDDKTWDVLDEKICNCELSKGEYQSASWPVSISKLKYYSKFRIKMTDTDGDGDYFLCCSGFEIYGDVLMIGISSGDVSKRMILGGRQYFFDGKWDYFLLFKLKEFKTKYKYVTDYKPFAELKLSFNDKVYYGYAKTPGSDSDSGLNFATGYHRILLGSEDEIPKMMKYKVGKEQEQEIPNIIWEDMEECMDENIKERKCMKTDEYELYIERIKTYCNGQIIPRFTACKTFVDPDCDVDDCKEVSFGDYGSAYGHKCFMMEINDVLSLMKIYYAKDDNRVYTVDRDTVNASIVLRGHYRFDLFNEERFELFNCLELRDDGVKSIHYTPQDITQIVVINVRYAWLRKQCLYGQDDQFNIYRSLCFMHPRLPQSDIERMVRVAIGVLCLTLQIFLTIGIMSEVINNWNTDMMFDNDDIIIAISFLAFSFFSLIYFFTVEKYVQFYDNMHLICEISYMIILMDFISNILLGFIICMFSFFYLLQSETVTDVVLNSFALGFIIELDDMANLFESDEDKLVDADWDHISRYPNAFHSGDYDCVKRKRKIVLFPNCIPYCAVLMILLLSPFILIGAIGRFLNKISHYLYSRHGWNWKTYCCCCCKSKRL